MSAIGDFEEADAYDTAPADPEQVAIKLHQVRREHSLEDADWDELDDDERAERVAIIFRLLAWLRRQGAT